MSGEMIDKIKGAEKEAQEIIKKAGEEKGLMIENAQGGIKELKEKEIESTRKKAAEILAGAIKEGEEESASMSRLCEKRRKEIQGMAQKNMKKAVSLIIEEVKKSMR